MNKIGEKITEERKIKGLSQEELAKLSKVDLKTVKQIENNEIVPQKKTIKLICKALDINATDVLNCGKYQNKNFLILFHLSVIVSMIIPGGSLVLPLILWTLKKDKISELDKIGTNLLNFQIVWTGLLFFTAFLKVLHLPHISNIFIGLYALNIILSITFAIIISFGKTKIFYPNIIKMIK